MSKMWKVWQKDPDLLEEDCSNENKCSKCQENNLAFSRTCNVYKSKENHESEISEKYNFPRSKKNSGILHKSEHLCQCRTEGESNQQYKSTK